MKYIHLKRNKTILRKFDIHHHEYKQTKQINWCKKYQQQQQTNEREKRYWESHEIETNHMCPADIWRIHAYCFDVYLVVLLYVHLGEGAQ